MNRGILLIALVIAVIFTAAKATSPPHLCPRKCPPCPQRFAPCEFGEEFDFCGCCTICLSGEGEQCGISRTKCADGLFCENEKSKGWSRSSSKVCKSDRDKCRYLCQYGLCGPKPRCQYGIGKGVCNCCDVCREGPGQKCGGTLRCGKGLFCEFSYSGGICKPILPPFL